ncbi:MAG: type VI secretion system tip protein TssI/VgrG [Myxococcota bacterium]
MAGRDLPVIRAEGEAQLHAPFVIGVWVRLPPGTPAPARGQDASLQLSFGDEPHALAGVVDAVVVSAEGVRVTIVPPVARLTEGVNHDVVCNVDAITRATTVLEGYDLEVATRCAEPPSPRPQRVQAFERDLDFVSRLLAEAGLCWFCDQSGEGDTSVVIADGAGSFLPIAGAGGATLPYRAADGMAEGEAITSVSLSHRLAPERVEVRDHDFEKPELDLTAVAGTGALTAYRFSGPGGYADAAAGKALAKRWLEAERRDAIVLQATSTCHRLWPGRTFTLVDAPRDGLNRGWLVVAMAFKGRQGSDGDGAGEKLVFEAEITAVPDDVAWRPEVPARPSMGGVQTADITGPAGEEIHTDTQGRVKTLLRHDVDGAADDTASAWTRVLHPPTSGGFFLPRTGWEVLVGFSREGGDEPYVLGRLDNGAAPTAESLPGEQVRSNFGTPTTPGGGSANMFRMTDRAGAEDMALVASHDWNEQTKANKSVTVKGSVAQNVGSNHDGNYETNRGLKVDAALTSNVGGNRTLSAGEGIVLEAAAETVSVGGTRAFTVGGDQISKVGGALSRTVGGAKVSVPIAGNNRHVDGSSSMVVGGAWAETGATSSVSVAGTSMLSCSATVIKAAKYSLAATALTETCGARVESAPNVSLSSGGALALTFAAITLKAPTVVIKGSSIKVAAGGGILSVAPGRVKFTGVLKAGGHVRSKGNAKHG